MGRQMKLDPRSYIMSRIRSSATKPELMVRKMVKELTPCRLRYNYKPLPGKPDIFVSEERLAIFVHGCFWHACSRHYTTPRTNPKFWDDKVTANARRDRRNIRKLVRLGIRCMEIWEHELIDNAKVQGRLIRALGE